MKTTVIAATLPRDKNEQASWIGLNASYRDADGNVLDPNGQSVSQVMLWWLPGGGVHVYGAGFDERVGGEVAAFLRKAFAPTWLIKADLTP